MIFFFIPLLFWQCSDEVKTTRRYVALEPVTMSVEEARNGFDVLPPTEISTSGKIYWKDGYLFIAEPNKGIHIYNNTTPTNPIPVSFIQIPGNTDLAVKGQTMYANSFADLISLDISDPTNIQLLNRTEDVFISQMYQYYIDSEYVYIVDWEEKEIVEEVDNSASYYYNNGMLYVDTNLADTESFSVSGSTGISGSMAKFTISKDHLYTIDESSLYVFDLSDGKTPVQSTSQYIDGGIETIFPYKNSLFIGSQNGMYIYDIQSPETPTQLSAYAHIFSCDPVVANDSLAFVTLRDGTACRSDFSNQLEIIDIKDLSDPKLRYTYEMDHPHGLGISGYNLFICEGESGLKWFNYEDISSIDKALIEHIQNIHAYDVIPLEDILIMVGDDGVYQYDYSDTGHLKLLSKISLSEDVEI